MCAELVCFQSTSLGKYFLSKEYSAQSCNAGFGPQNPSFEDEWQSYVIWEHKNVYSVGAVHSRRSDYFSHIFKCAAKMLFWSLN